MVCGTNIVRCRPKRTVPHHWGPIGAGTGENLVMASASLGGGMLGLRHAVEGPVKRGIYRVHRRLIIPLLRLTCT